MFNFIQKSVFDPNTCTLNCVPLTGTVYVHWVIFPVWGWNNSGDKHSSLERAIFLYKVEDNDKSDCRYESVIHVKMYNVRMATKKNLKKLNFPVIKYFDHQGPGVILMIREMVLIFFEHLGINTCRGIDQKWMFVD